MFSFLRKRFASRATPKRMLLIRDHMTGKSYLLGDWFIPPNEIVCDLRDRGMLAGAQHLVSTASANMEIPDQASKELVAYVKMFAAAKIKSLPECREFWGLPFTIYYHNGKVVKATSSIQSAKEIKDIIKDVFT